MLDTPYIGELFALLSPLAWSFAVILFRKTGEHVPAVALTVFKNSAAIVLYLLTFLAFGAVGPVQVSWHDYALLLGSGVIGIALADTLFFLCLNRVGASKQAIINTAYSPPIIFLSVIFLGERLTAWQVFGVCLILGAVFSVSTSSKSGTGERPRALVSGVLLGLGACLAQAISIVMIKPYMADWPLLWMTTWRIAGGLLATLLILPALPASQRSLRSLRNARVWKFMVPAVFIGTYVSLLLWMGGFKYADASVASALNQTSTLFTFLLAVVILKEPVTKRGLAGLGLGVLGVALVTFLGPKAQGQAPAVTTSHVQEARDSSPSELEGLRARGEPVYPEDLLKDDSGGDPTTLAELQHFLAATGTAEWQPYPQLPVSAQFDALQRLSDAATLAARSGRSSQARQELERAFQLARSTSGRPWILGSQLANASVELCTDALQSCLNHLPPSVDLSSIEASLRGWQPRELCLAALRGDRTFANRIFQRLREGESLAEPMGEGSHLPTDPRALDQDQRLYLDLMQAVITQCERPHFDPQMRFDAYVEHTLDSADDVTITRLFLPRVSEFHAGLLRAEVIRQLALTALEARREGVESARARLMALTDPFSGAAYRTRIEADGSLLMWSVGSDGVDDEALVDPEWNEFTDIVWHLRAADREPR